MHPVHWMAGLMENKVSDMAAKGRVFSPWLVSAVLLVVVTILWLSYPPTITQAQAQSQVPRLQGTTHPNLSGVWQAVNEANWDLEGHASRAARLLSPGVPGGALVPAAPVLALGATGGIPGSLGVVDGGEIPYKPETLATKKDNFEHSLERDPEVKCLTLGVPRMTYLPYPFQIAQSDTKMMLVYGYSNVGRTVHLDKVEDPGYPIWMGYSVGKWEGDTLVVDTTEFNTTNWLDRAGNFVSENVHVTERYTPISKDHITYEVTIDDPTVFTRPWKMSMPLYRRVEKNARVFEYRCVEMAEELVYGHLRKNQLVKQWEGDYGRRGGTLAVGIIRKPTQEKDEVQ
jgi:hypothetical protein